MESITIIAKRWFDKVNGNTYFSADALIDGKPAARIDYEYGYGTHYEHAMFRKLEESGLLPVPRERYAHGTPEAPWRYCDRNGITYYATHTDVRRKKDLK